MAKSLLAFCIRPTRNPTSRKTSTIVSSVWKVCSRTNNQTAEANFNTVNRYAPVCRDLKHNLTVGVTERKDTHSCVLVPRTLPAVVSSSREPRRTSARRDGRTGGGTRSGRLLHPGHFPSSRPQPKAQLFSHITELGILMWFDFL
ncbi:insulin receptor-related protein-like protein [Anopheles sinensis]|uniref:Insulin receptor-related protein-like protein n=1 Tax=Anopheles sinensis TaxID=74873 RepID=A0A084WLB7_ANOSI|nr:insulin receptor-related protein-like protein [Anopheles sinensis]